MAQPGRKSAASLSVVGEVTSLRRLAPAPGLTQAQLQIWLATVNSKPAEWFGDEHAPILLEYVRHVATAEVLSRQIEEFDPAWMADDDGLRRFDKLTAMRAREAGVINTLARSMRLTQQAVYRANKAATLGDAGRGRKPWQTIEG